MSSCLHRIAKFSTAAAVTYILLQGESNNKSHFLIIEEGSKNPLQVGSEPIRSPKNGLDATSSNIVLVTEQCGQPPIGGNGPLAIFPQLWSFLAIDFLQV